MPEPIREQPLKSSWDVSTVGIDISQHSRQQYRHERKRVLRLRTIRCDLWNSLQVPPSQDSPGFVRSRGRRISASAVAASWESLGAESNPPPAAASQIQGTNSQEVVQLYLQLQEQLRVTQLAIDQTRQETKEAVAQTAEALSKALQTMQETFAAQRARDWEAMQKSNNAMLIVAGTFAAIGFLAIAHHDLFSMAHEQKPGWDFHRLAHEPRVWPGLRCGRARPRGFAPWLRATRSNNRTCVCSAR